MIKIAVVILNYNGKSLLQKFLPSVLKFSDDAVIFLADNFSTDGSTEMVRADFPSVRVIQLQANLGFCDGYNVALQQVDAAYYVLLNSDVEVTEGWLRPQVHLMDTDSSIAAVQPKVLAWDRRELFEYAGAAGGMIDILGYPFCRGRVFDTVEADLGQYNDTRPVFWATGACLMIRSSAFHEMGGFDNDFFAHMEEIDLCWKLNRAGKQVYYCGESIVYHVGGGTLSRLDPRKTFLNFRNGLFLILKNMDAGSLIWNLPLRIALDWLALFLFLARGSLKNAGAVLKAHLAFLAGIRKTLNKRKVYAGLGFKTTNGGIYQGSIVVAYFVKGRKTFADLNR